MRSLKEALRSTEQQQGSNAFDKRFRKEDGGDIFIPGHVIDFVERDAKDATMFDPDNYNNMNLRTRNTKSKKRYDIHHIVTHRHVKHRTSVVDKR